MPFSLFKFRRFKVIENRTLSTDIEPHGTPMKPSLTSMQMPTPNGYGLRINWHPHVDWSPGSNFYAKYRKIGSNAWNYTEEIYDEDFVTVYGLSVGTYEIAVVSLGDRGEEKESEIEFGEIVNIGMFAKVVQLSVTHDFRGIYSISLIGLLKQT